MVALVYLLFCVRFVNSTCIALSQNETAVINPRKYFSSDVAGFEIKSVGEHNAAIVEPENATELLRIETENSDWNFGPSLFVDNIHFFTMLYSDKMEVWKANGDSVDRVWAVQATLGRVVPLHMHEVSGFVYWTQPDLNLFFLNLHLRELSAKSIQGVDTTGATHIVVCSFAKFIVVVTPSLQGNIFSHYKVDYTFLTAVKEDIKLIEVFEEALLDAHCTLHLFLLTPTALLVPERTENIELFHIPASFGTVHSIHFFGLTQLLALCAEGGAIITLTDKVVFLPGVLQVLQLEPVIVLLEPIGSRLVLTVRKSSNPKELAVKQVVSLHQELQRTDDLLWLGNSHHQSALLLVKRGRIVTRMIVDLRDSILTISSSAIPYTFDLCALDFEHKSTCTQITVKTYWNKPGDISLSNCSEDQSTIALSFLLKREFTEVLYLSEFISGWNMQERLSLPVSPSYFACSVYHYFDIDENLEIIEEEAGSDKLLSVISVEMKVSFLIFRNGHVMEKSKLSTIDLFSTTLSVVSCAAVGNRFYFCYAEDSEEGYLLVWRGGVLAQYSLKSRGYISMLATERHVLILIENCVHIVEIEDIQWQQIEGQYAEMWAGEGKLVLRTAAFLEFYELLGNVYIFRGRPVIPADVSQFALSTQVLLLLHSNNTLSIYHLSGYNQLLFKFSVFLDCPVSFLMANEKFAVYRCPTHIQILHAYENKNSLLSKTIAADNSSIWKRLISKYLFEVHKKGNSWQVFRFSLSRESVQFWVLIFRVAEGANVPGPVSIQGQLALTSQYSAHNFVVNITLENHGDIIVPSHNSAHNDENHRIEETFTVEIPLGERVIIPALDLFQGKEMTVSAESNSDFIRTKIHGPVTIQNFLIFLRTYSAVALVPEIQILFATDGKSLIANKYECRGKHCKITSKHSISLDAIGVRFASRLELMVSSGRYTLFRIQTQSISIYEESSFSGVIVCYDSEQSSFEVVHRQSFARNFYILPAKLPNTFHLFFYSAVLEHCTARAQNQINCTEVAESGLVQIESVGSVKASEESWHVYVITRMLRLFTFELGENLSILRSSTLRTSDSEELLVTIIAGDRLLASTEKSSLLFSLPELSLLSAEPRWIDGMTFRQVQLWRVRSEASVRFVTQAKQHILHLLDLAAPPHSIVVAQIPFLNFQFTGESSGFAVDNNTAVMLSFAEGEILLERSKAGETEVIITAKNDLSAVSVKVKARLAGNLWSLQIVAVGTVGICCAGIVFYRKKQQPRAAPELEMERIA